MTGSRVETISFNPPIMYISLQHLIIVFLFSQKKKSLAFHSNCHLIFFEETLVDSHYLKHQGTKIFGFREQLLRLKELRYMEHTVS